jgi:hypothetical protein
MPDAVQEHGKRLWEPDMDAFHDHQATEVLSAIADA